MRLSSRVPSRLWAYILLLGFCYPVGASEGVPEGLGKDEVMTSTTRVSMEIDGKTVEVTLEDSAATRDFLAQLPLTLTFEDYHGIEKVSDLPARLSTEGAPAGFDPEVGSFAYYAPWGNLAIFYRDFGYARSLVNLGKITKGLERLKQPGKFTATISLVD